VSAENPQLYFEIQNLNDYGLESLQGLKKAIDRLYSAVSNKEEGEFVAMMGRGREYFAERSRGD
jgi:chorismate mutase/prephenate dehydrogenase